MCFAMYLGSSIFTGHWTSISIVIVGIESASIFVIVSIIPEDQRILHMPEFL